MNIRNIYLLPKDAREDVDQHWSQKDVNDRPDDEGPSWGCDLGYKLIWNIRRGRQKWIWGAQI